MTTASTALLTDHYELTMVQAALRAGTAHRRSVFELFPRRLPEGRRYGVVAGVGRVLDAFERFRFDDEVLEVLRKGKVVDDSTLQWLADYRFSGDIWGYPEGEIYFPYSPLMVVESTFARMFRFFVGSFARFTVIPSPRFLYSAMTSSVSALMRLKLAMRGPDCALTTMVEAPVVGVGVGSLLLLVFSGVSLTRRLQRMYLQAWRLEPLPGVRGSLNAALGQWLAGTRLPSSYVARQGTALRRTGLVHVVRAVDGEVRVGGDTRTVLVGTASL